MTDDDESNRDDSARHVAFDLDALGEYVPTGDPLIDRGAKLTLREMIEAESDPEHPDHEAAVAVAARLAEQYSAMINDQFGRIGENLAAAVTPGFGRLFEATSPVPRPSISSYLRRSSKVASENQLDVELDETPQLTLDALLAVSERMSEMVRVSAEQRDVAIAQMRHFKNEAVEARKAERHMLWLTWAALVGTWVAVVAAFIAL